MKRTRDGGLTRAWNESLPKRGTARPEDRHLPWPRARRRRPFERRDVAVTGSPYDTGGRPCWRSSVALRADEVHIVTQQVSERRTDSAIARRSQIIQATIEAIADVGYRHASFVVIAKRGADQQHPADLIPLH